MTQPLGVVAATAAFSTAASVVVVAFGASETMQTFSAETPDPLPMPLQSLLVAEAQARINRAAPNKGSGAEQLAGYFVGQVVGQLNKVQPARQVVQDMVEEFIDAVQDLVKLHGE